MSVELAERADGVILPVRAQPGARADGIRGTHAGMLKVAVTQAAEKGKANEAIARVLAAALAIKPSQVELVSGATARQKRFLVRGIARDDLARRIAAVLDAS